MVISWLGEAGIRLQTKDTVIIIDPPAASTGLKPSKQVAHIVGLTTSVGRDAKSLSGEPFLIATPGEYERQNVFVYGIQLAGDPDHLHFRIEAEDMSIGHLGNVAQKLENGQLDAFEGVDVLCVPVGGKGVLNAETAAELIAQIEPRIIIPIQHACPGSTSGYATVAGFLKEMGAKSSDVEDKLKITKKELPAEESRVVVLKP